MSTQDEHIREIFSKSLEHFEAPVDPSVWAGVQSGIGAGAAGAGSAGIGGLSLLKIVAAVVIAGSVITAVVLSTGGDKDSEAITQSEEVTPSPAEENEEVENASLTQNDDDIKPEVSNEANQAAVQENGESQLPITADSEERFIDVAPSQEPEKEIKSTPMLRGASPEGTPSNIDEPEISNPTPEVETPTVEVDAEFVAVQDDHIYNLFRFAPVTLMEGEYTWDFGDGEVTSGSEVFHEYFDDGEFMVTLTLTVGEQTKQQEVKILVVEPSQISVPNVFSPNGDSWNNYFDVEAQSKNIELITLVIFDPQGNKVFEADEYRKKWDGNDLFGNPCRGGVYTYWFEAHGSDGKHWKEPGTVTLVE